MIERRLVTIALRDLIETATGKRCGLVTVPLEGTSTVPPPFYVLTPVSNTVHGAPMADMSEDATLVYQVTCVSGPVPGDPSSRGGVDQAEWLADKARTAILGRDLGSRQWLHPLTVAGARCIARRPEIEPGATNLPGDATITYVIRFVFDLTTA